MSFTRRLRAAGPAGSIFLLALLIRILYNVTVARNYTPVYDAALYDMLARNMLNHGCYCLRDIHRSSVSRPPLWPFIMAAIYFFTGQNAFFARLFYCFLGAGTCVLVYFFARDLFGRRIALASGIIAALYPCMFIYDGWLYTESLYTFCLTAFTYALYRLQFTPRSIQPAAGKTWAHRAWHTLFANRLAILCGILAGLSALTRPDGILLVALVVFWAIIVALAKMLPWRVVIKDIIIITCLAFLLVLPWTYRNYRVTHHFVLVSMGMGEVLKGAYNDVVLSGDPSVRGQWRPPANSLNHDDASYTPANDAQDTAAALAWIRTHLSAMPYLLGLHFVNMWIPYTYSHGLAFEEPVVSRQIFNQMVTLIDITAIIVIAGAVLGLLLTWKRRWQALLTVYLLLAFTIGQNIVFYSNMRFRAPIEPMLVLLTGGLFWWLLQRLPAHQARQQFRDQQKDQVQAQQYQKHKIERGGEAGNIGEQLLVKNQRATDPEQNTQQQRQHQQTGQ